MKSNCALETRDFGKILGARLKPGAVVALIGDLGSGKTTLIQGIVSALSEENPLNVTSPTFNYVNTYSDFIHHFDLYRLENIQDFIQRGFVDYFDENSICCIEWPEKIISLLPNSTLFIELAYEGEGIRQITLREGQ